MHPRIGPSASEISYVTSAPRPTPTPVNVKFAEVLARNAGALARSADAAMRSLPGAPLVALAVRGGTGSLGIGNGGFGAGGPLMSTRNGPAPPAGASPEGPGGAGAAVDPRSSGGAGGDAGIESSLAQSQEMNMYFLRIQEEMNSQNRTYSALSNVLKAQHDTVKNAISNIR